MKKWLDSKIKCGVVGDVATTKLVLVALVRTELERVENILKVSIE